MLQLPRPLIFASTFAFVLPLAPLAACSDDAAVDGDGGETDPNSDSAEGDGGDGGDPGDGGDGDGDDESDTGEELPQLGLCGETPPAGAELAPELPTYGGPGTCPTLETGLTGNTLETDHGERSFLVIAPTDLGAEESLPVLFLYHWLGGASLSFYSRAEVQDAADYYRFIALIPDGRVNSDGVPFRWPFSMADSEMAIEEEISFHDDLLACVAEQFLVNKECVSSMGVSAGAMWSAVLASRHGEHLSSFVSLSGGIGGEFVQPWQPAEHTMPALVLWGGRDDICLTVDFDAISRGLEAELEADEHFMVECIHNCTHATPPFEAPDPAMPTYAPAWEFVLDHPYWLEDGDSPYLEYSEITGGLPPVWPDWCGIGSGSAMIRQGVCGGSEC